MEEKKLSPKSKRDKQNSNDVEIDESFFKQILIPQVYSVIVCNVKTNSASFFNFVFALQLANSNNTINEKEMEFCMT